MLYPVILFGETVAERAKETGAGERTLHDQAMRFEQEGMAGLFREAGLWLSCHNVGLRWLNHR